MAKRSFYKTANAILGKVGGRAPEDVILELIIRSKCLPALLYGLEACPLRKSDISSLYFVVNRFFVKLFQTNNIDIVNYCRAQFEFDLPRTVVEKRSKKFVAKYRSCENVIIICVTCSFVVIFFFFVLISAVLFVEFFLSHYDE